MIPPFEASGNLPPGIYAATWEEIVDRFGLTAQRRRLLDGLEAAVAALRRAGCRTVYIDGSFVTAKLVPGDFDACWEPDGVDPLLLDPVLLTFERGRRAQKAKYGGELFIAQWPADAAGTVFLDYFQLDPITERPKGIIMLELGGAP